MSELELYPDVADKEKYEFEIFYRDDNNWVLGKLALPNNILTYYVYKNDEIYIVESQKIMNFIISPSDIGLLDHSGLFGIPFLNEDYEIVLNPENTWTLMDYDLYKDAKDRGEFCEYFEKILTPFYRKKKIKKLFPK